MEKCNVQHICTSLAHAHPHCNPEQTLTLYPHCSPAKAACSAPLARVCRCFRFEGAHKLLFSSRSAPLARVCTRGGSAVYTARLLSGNALLRAEEGRPSGQPMLLRATRAPQRQPTRPKPTLHPVNAEFATEPAAAAAVVAGTRKRSAENSSPVATRAQ